MYIELANNVIEGNCDALDSYIALKKAQAELETALKLVQPFALTEAEKYGQKSFKAFNASIELKNGPSTYKFCPSITQMEEELKKIEDMAKLGSFVYEPTGEVIDQASKVEGKSTIAISFKLLKP